MRGAKAAISLVSILLVLLFGIVYMSFVVLKFDPFKDFTNAKLLLTNSGGVAPNSPILLTGVEVGKVTAVNKVATGAEVEFRIDDKYRIPAASKVRVENMSALGEPYIEFEPTSNDGPYLENDQLIESRLVEQPTSIPQLSLRVVELIEQFDPQTMSSLVNTFDQGLANTESAIPVLERSTKLLAATILSRTASIDQLLIGLQSIGGDMAWAGPALSESGPKWAGFGVVIDDLITKVSPAIEDPGTPEKYMTGDGLVPFLQKLQGFLNKVGPSAAELHPMVQPLFDDLQGLAPRFDISTLISQAVNTVGDDGALHLQINVK